MTHWPDEAIQVAATWYIRKSSMHEDRWRFTRLLALHSAVNSSVTLQNNELPIVSCEIDPACWYLMTSRRLLARCNNIDFEAKPLQIKECEWGDFKTELKPQIGDAEVSMRNGEKYRFQYETGYASMAPIYYWLFWGVKFPALGSLDIARLRREIGTSR